MHFELDETDDAPIMAHHKICDRKINQLGFGERWRGSYYNFNETKMCKKQMGKVHLKTYVTLYNNKHSAVYPNGIHIFMHSIPAMVVAKITNKNILILRF